MAPALLLALLMLPATSYLHAAFAPAGRELWVDAELGSDQNDGLSRDGAFRTIQRAASVAMPGDTISILPGVYRESVVPTNDGTATEPITYVAAGGPGSVVIRGSEPSSQLSWSRLESNTIGLPAQVDPKNIYFADLSAWGLTQPPRFIVQLNDKGEVVSRLMPARAPNWQVKTDWKVNEFWWMANGGRDVAGCDPTTNANHECDLPWRSFNQLTDTTSDTAPAGIEPGNLTTLGDLTGATLVAMDAQHAFYVYRRTIIADDVAAGRITVDQNCDNDGSPGLGWGTKYYVENHPALLDQPGEWWFDVKHGRLYLWAPNGGNPGELNLEISRWNTGFDLSNRSYTTLDGLTIELFNGRAYAIWNENPTYKAFGNVIRNSTLRYANEGVRLYQYVDDRTPPTYAIDTFTLEGSEIAHMDTSGIDTGFWWPGAPAPASFNHSGVRNAVFVNNDFHDLGFNSDARSPVGVRIFFPDRIRFEGNHIYDVASAGAHFHLSIIDSPKQFGFAPQEIKTGDILVANNLFERTCLLSSDCGGLKFGGDSRPYSHVFRDVLVVGNVFRDITGWSYVSGLRGLNPIGDGDGFYLDNGSGIHVYRNIAYNNTGAGFKLNCLWRDGDAIFYNNIAANNFMYGFKLTGTGSCDNHNGSVNTQLVNNILVNNDAFGMQLESAYASGNFGNLVINHNLYYLNGWNGDAAQGKPADIRLIQGSGKSLYLQSLSEIQAGTPWERNGIEANPNFMSYDAADHNRFDGSWPDFDLTPASPGALDQGAINLPASLSSLLTEFKIPAGPAGPAFDLGRLETEPTTAAAPTLQPRAPAKPTGSTCWPLPAALLVAPLLLNRLHRAKSQDNSQMEETHEYQN